MTENNLGVHLRWFLKGGSEQPPQPAYASLLPELSPANIIPRNDCSQASQIVSAGVELPGLDANSGSHQPSHSFARPGRPASVLNAQSEDAMARLQSGRRDNNKPRLLSEALPVTLQTPSNPAKRVPGTSLRDQYTAQLECKSSCELRVTVDLCKRRKQY